MSLVLLCQGWPLLLWPSVYQSYQAYEHLSRFLPQRVLGAAIVGIAIWRIVAVVTWSTTARIFSIMASLTLWLYLAIWFMGSWPPAGVRSLLYFLIDVWTFFRIQRSQP